MAGVGEDDAGGHIAYFTRCTGGDAEENIDKEPTVSEADTEIYTPLQANDLDESEYGEEENEGKNEEEQEEGVDEEGEEVDEERQEDREGEEDDDDDDEEEADGEAEENENRRRAFEQIAKHGRAILRKIMKINTLYKNFIKAKRKAAQVQTGRGVSRKEKQEDRYLHRLQNHSTDLQQHYQQQHQQQQQQQQEHRLTDEDAAVDDSDTVSENFTYIELRAENSQKFQKFEVLGRHSRYILSRKVLAIS
ncbi:hypothetical protein P5V15_002658 [Pogonomyrmex californicus]